jgi:hypothetical protein
MKFEVFNDPILLDFIRVILNAQPDQIEHFMTMTGEPWAIDSIALGNFTAPGPKWSIRIDDVPVVVGGFAPLHKGVYRDWFISTPAAFEPANYFRITRICRKLMDAMLKNGVHRIQCIAPAARIEHNPRLERWYAAMGYKKEALHSGYCATGADAICYSRVKA